MAQAVSCKLQAASKPYQEEGKLLKACCTLCTTHLKPLTPKSWWF